MGELVGDGAVAGEVEPVEALAVGFFVATVKAGVVNGANTEAPGLSGGEPPPQSSDATQT